EVVSSQPQQGETDDRGERGGDDGRKRKRGQKRPLRLGDEHSGRVCADAEERDVAEGRVACDAADDVPRRRQDDEHRDVGGDPEPQPVGQERDVGRLGGLQGGQRGEQRVRDQDAAEDQEHPSPPGVRVWGGDHRRRPIRPWGRVTRTMTMRPNAIALANTEPEPGIDCPKASTSPKSTPPPNAALTLASPPTITTTNACSV